ncbi:MAG: hypothetical protein MUP52_04350 [Candidatus Aminicenantes bacterium]|nr:hypothetical protein [Candidatus Aminicenantes bacterium]
MGKRIIRGALVCLVILLFSSSCNSPTSPSIPYVPPPKANIVLDGGLTKTMTDYGCPQFEGYVKNIGNNTGYNCMVEIACFSDANKTTIIDTAVGFPADLGDIAPGIRAYFEAVAFDCTSHDQIKGTTVKITWLDR